MPLGLLEHYCPAVELLYQCLDRCRFARISVEDFERIFFYSSPEYMKELTTILAYMGIFALDAHNERGNLSGFQTIKDRCYRVICTVTRSIVENVKACPLLLLNGPIFRAAMFIRF